MTVWRVNESGDTIINFYILILRKECGLRMGCQQSQLSGKLQLGEDVPHKEGKGGGRRKLKNQKMNGRLSLNQIFENIRRMDYPKTPADLELLETTISKHFLLFKLTKSERKQLAAAMEAYQTDVGEYVFQQGTPASMFFIINFGEVQIEINNSPVKTMKRGDFFGELAIIYSSPRSASVKVLTPCSFWCLSQAEFLKIQREMVKNNFKMAKPYVHKLPLFNFLTNKQRDAISYNMNTLKYEQDDVLFDTGDDATSFFIIIQGTVQITIPGKPSLILKNGDCFGENCLKNDQKRLGTAKCLEKTEFLAISRQDLKSCLGCKSQEELLFHNIIKWSLRRSSLFGHFNSFEQERFIQFGQIATKRDGEMLVPQGENDENIYVSLEGKISSHEVGDIINEEEAQEETNDLFIARETLTKQGNGSVFVIRLRDVQLILFKDQKKKTVENIKQQETTKTETEMHKSGVAAPKIEFKDLYIMSKLGEGQMGRVFLVQNKKSEKKYALKCVQRNMVVKHQMEKFLRCEKEILLACNFPLIVKLVESYKDTHFIYFLLEYIEGGDFFDFLGELGICNNSTARFYFGCLLLCVEYLHANSIVYRDLKPENAALDANGYLHMVDMGTAKLLTEQETGLRTFTIIGTPHYMAPQVMQAKGYSFSVDVWSLGIILYEMVCGVLPYGSYSDDPVAIYQEIQNNQLLFPKNYSDPAGKTLIRRLLLKHPDRRAVEDFSEIKNMEYFEKFSWKQLETQKMVPPIHPKSYDFRPQTRSQYLLSYLKKEKSKMDRPLVSHNTRWDQIF